MEHLMGESVEKRRRIPLGSENGCFSFHLDLLWPTERTILVEMENFHLLLSSPPRWQDERNALGRNLCLISISRIPSTSLSFASYLVSEQTKNRTIKESYRTRSFCHERYTISSDIILHAVYFTRCSVVPPSRGKILFRRSIARTLKNTRMRWIFSLERKLYGNSVDRSTSVSK